MRSLTIKYPYTSRPERTKGCLLLKKPGVVVAEALRTFVWLMGYRRFVRDYELLSETLDIFIYLAMLCFMGDAIGIKSDL
jgi:hypothetical protein